MSRFYRFFSSEPSLKDFILKAQVISLYRDILRTCNAVKKTGDKSAAVELSKWARSEFDLNRTLENKYEISRAVTRGRSQLRDTQKTLSLADRYR